MALYHGLVASAGVRLRAEETEISAALWALEARERTLLYFFTVGTRGGSLPYWFLPPTPTPPNAQINNTRSSYNTYPGVHI